MLPGWPRAVTALQPSGQRAPARYGLNYCGLGLGWDQGLVPGCQLSLGRVSRGSAPCLAEHRVQAQRAVPGQRAARRPRVPALAAGPHARGPGRRLPCAGALRHRRGGCPRSQCPRVPSEVPRPGVTPAEAVWLRDRALCAPQRPFCSSSSQKLNPPLPAPCTPWVVPSSRVSPHCFGVPVEPSACPGSLQHPWVQQIAAGSGLGGTLAPKRCLREALCAFPSAFRTY